MISYFIMAHHKPHQLTRLLKAVYDPDNIYMIHVDLKAEPSMHELVQNYAAAYPNIKVLNSRNLSWGGWSLVQVEIDAIRELLNYDWTHYINLSGQDFPLVNQKKIAAFLEPAKSYLDVRELPAETRAYTEKYYVEDCGQMKVLGDREPFENYFVEGIKPYRGSQWKILNRAAAVYSVSSTFSYQVQDYFRYSLMSDESYFQTLLMNSELSGTVEKNNYRFLDMEATPEGFYRPITLTTDYLVPMFNSSALIARKFDIDQSPEVVQHLENLL